MRLAITLLGLDLLTLEFTTTMDAEEDYSRDLSGGILASDRIEAGTTDLTLGVHWRLGR